MINQLMFWIFALVTFGIIFGTAHAVRTRDALERCIKHHPSNINKEGQ
jgi:hypothetical protein